MTNGTVTDAHRVAAGAFTADAQRGPSQFADLPAFCLVAATLRPTSESEIKIAVWLPVAGWNGKFLGVGNGGWTGDIRSAALAAALRRGYAAAGTDTGHEGSGGPWMQNREKLIDFGYRAIHEMAVTAKRVVDEFYGAAPSRSYFNGCSGGGRQGVMASQRYPEDFDGIVAGSPVLNATGRAAFSMWIAQNVHKDEASFIPEAKLPAIHDAVLQACDALDGVTDRLIGNPAACRFDPQVLACQDEDTATCLTPSQVASARTVYEPLVNPHNNKEIFPGLAYGSELGWTTFGGPEPFRIGAEMFQFMVFQDPNWDYTALNFDSHMAEVRRLEGGNIDALDPDLTRFFASGGKLIQYHGWADPQIVPAVSTGYYEAVVKSMGRHVDAVTNNYRLFMVPGMGHCGGGTGPSTFDMLTALEDWVEHGKAPDSVVASRVVNGRVERTRPLCPYPQRSVYRGSGSIDEAANFVCK